MALSTDRGQAALELIFAAIFVTSALIAFVLLAKSADQILRNDRFSSQEALRWYE